MTDTLTLTTEVVDRIEWEFTERGWYPGAGDFLALVAMARRSLAPTPAVEADMVLVPREPTREMLNAGGNYRHYWCIRDSIASNERADLAGRYSAMLAALHPPPPPKGRPMTPVDEAEVEAVARVFPMQNGPVIPWALAEVIYAAYSAVYGTSQSLERLSQRGGFGWAEVPVIFKDYEKRFGSQKRLALQETARAALDAHRAKGAAP